jgi:predicted transporter
MTRNQAARFDRTLRIVMWLDAFLSAALAVVCVLVSPVLALVGVPAGVLPAIGITAAVLAVLLAAFGAITAVAFARRLRTGDYLMPVSLKLPLPAAMRPNSQ